MYDTQVNIKIRQRLMSEISKHIDRKQMTQAQAALHLGITQPRISNLVKQKVHLFTIDMLVNLLEKIGYEIDLKVEHPAEIL